MAVNSPCFVCGAPGSQLLFERDYLAFGYPGTFALRRCDGCGLLFNSPRLDGDELGKLYDGNYYFFNRNDADEFRRNAATVLRTVSLLDGDPAGKRIAEVGSAKGYLLAILKSLGCKVQGIELSAAAADYAASKLGVPTFTGTVEAYAHSPRRATHDVVMAIDVMEHVPTPGEFLSSVDAILEKTGWLIIDTPNGRAKNIETMGQDWLGFNPFHIFLFSADTLRRLLSRMNYTIEKCFTYGNRRRLGLSYPQRVKAVARQALLRLGVLGQSRRLYQRLLTIGHSDDVAAHLGDAVERTRAGPNFLGGEDATDELASELRGDNLVIIARKAGT